MDANTLRKKFLNFFEKNNHRIIPSDSLVPASDPSVLFTSAGMNQFKKQFLGIDIKSRRVATCQKCLRTGDLERVGKASGHHTFFEMLGNFSFGDYFKKEAIELAWKFLAKELKIDKHKLWISVHKSDKESFDIWSEDIRINKKRIVKMSDDTNFWPSDTTVMGPCGYCSEIFFDLGEEFGCENKNCSPQCSCGGSRFLEVWNLVFTEFDRQAKGKLVPLSQKNIDTGMGLERLAAVMGNVATNFETDLFQPIISEIGVLLPKNKPVNEPEKSFRVNAISDHLRAISFAIVDGVYPSNEERGYVVRTLVRRSFLFGRELGIEKPFLYKLVASLASIMGDTYPEFKSQRDEIATIIKSEEERFISTLDIRIPEFNKALKELSKKCVSEVGPEILFKFYDTFGLPWELMQREAKRFNLVCNKDRFLKLLDKQRKRSRGASRISDSIFVKLYDFKRPDIEFVDQHSIGAKVIAIFKEESEKKKTLVTQAFAPGYIEIVLDKTPFYAESGGQVGDRGTFKNSKTEIEVIDTNMTEGAILHKAKLLSGEIKINDEITASIDVERRFAIMRNHTATHLLQAVLRKVLGPHVRQQGSLVTDESLRFDFTHPVALKEEELKKIEDLVNDYIRADEKIKKETMSLEKARQTGALAFFGERYSDTVRVVSILDYSNELCGGSHLDSTGQIGFFKIRKESSVASGIRRISACTGEHARDFEKVKKIKKGQEQAEKEKADRKKTLEHHLADSKEIVFKKEVPLLLSQAKEIGEGIKCISIFQGNCDNSLLRRMSDSLKEKQGGLIVVLGSILKEKGIFVISLTVDLVRKGYSVSKGKNGKDVFSALRGELNKSYNIITIGGGKETLVQGSCPSKDIQKVIKLAPDIIKNKLKGIRQ